MFWKFSFPYNLVVSFLKILANRTLKENYIDDINEVRKILNGKRNSKFLLINVYQYCRRIVTVGRRNYQAEENHIDVKITLWRRHNNNKLIA